MKSRTVLLLALLVGVVVVAVAAPDFSGTWVLDKAKSDQPQGRGGQPGTPMDITLVIKQSGNDLQISRKMGDRSSDMKYTLDGKESKNPGGRGGETVSKCTWEGDNLVINATMDMQGREMTTKDLYAMSDGGKVLTITSTRGERSSKQVFNKQ